MSWFRRKTQSTVSHDEARCIQRAWWEWQQENPGMPIFEARIDLEGSAARWHGPTFYEATPDPPTEEEADFSILTDGDGRRWRIVGGICWGGEEL